MYEQNDRFELSSFSISGSDSVDNYNTCSNGSSISFSALGNSNLLNIACTNARSIVEKVDSLVTLFEV